MRAHIKNPNKGARFLNQVPIGGFSSFRGMGREKEKNKNRVEGLDLVYEVFERHVSSLNPNPETLKPKYCCGFRELL